MVDSGPGNAGLGSKVFFIWMAFCFLAVAFVWGFIYETKNLSLEQVDELYRLCDKAHNSAVFRRNWDQEGATSSVGSQPEKGIEKDEHQPHVTISP